MKKKTYSSKKKSSAPRRKMYTRRPRGVSSLYRTRIFTETLQASPLQCNANLTGSGPGQNWYIDMNSLPQIAQYQALYSQYKILKIRYTFVPDFNSYEKNQGLANLGMGGPIDSTPTFAYAIQRDVKDLVVAPPNELAILTQNGCRVTTLTKPYHVTIKNPLPDVTVGTSASGTANPVQWEQRGWIDLQNDGVKVVHGGLQTYVTSAGGSTGIPFSVARVYCSVTFALRDPL